MRPTPSYRPDDREWRPPSAEQYAEAARIAAEPTHRAVAPSAAPQRPLTPGELTNAVATGVSAGLAIDRTQTEIARRVKEETDANNSPGMPRSPAQDAMVLAQWCFAVASGRTLAREPTLIAAKRYGAHALVTRALLATVGNDGGFLVPAGLSGEIIDALRPLTVVRKHTPASNVLPMPHGNLKIGRTNTAAPTIGWVGEDARNEIATAPSIGDIDLMAHKATASLPVSNSLLRYGDPLVERVLRDNLIKQLAVLEDQAFLTGVGSQYSPRGIRWSAATVIEATQSYSVTTAIADLKGVIAALETANVQMRSPVWFMSTKVRDYLATAVSTSGQFQFTGIDDGLLFGWPIAATTSIPTNLGGSSNQSEIYLVDMDEFIIAQAYLEITLRSSATYTDDSGNLASAFDRDESVIKLTAGIDCSLRHKESAAVLTLVPWGN